MSLANIKLNSAKRGFTIVELLIVVVVIAILAAITIVSYNGITNRANASASKALASTWQKKIELYQAEKSTYPVSVTNMADNSNAPYYFSAAEAGAALTASAPTATEGTKKVQLQVCGTAAAPTGVEISYYNYDNKTVSTVKVGTGTTCNVAFGA